MLTDYHTHTSRCGHATGTMREYVEKAIALGIDEIGLTDHLWLYFQDPSLRDPTFAMNERDFAAHYEEMIRTRTEYADRIKVRISVEADYIAGRERELLSILAQYDFDYVLGSVHFLDGWPLDAPESTTRYARGPVSPIYRSYYQNLQGAIALGAFHLLAHLDLPKKLGFRPEDDLSELVRDTLDLIAKHDLAVELSSAGLRKPVREIYPSSAILEQMNALSIPIALSSDAHAPAEVGAGYDRLITAARAAGYEQSVTFEKRVRRTHNLPREA
jgi:histidinol-phosphatase (PHP family)